MVEAFKRIAKKIEKLDGNSSSLTEIQFFNSVNNIKSEIAATGISRVLPEISLFLL